MNRQRTSPRVAAGAAGYSMVMVLLSLQIVIVMGLMAVPKLGAYMAGYRLTSASNQLGFEINRARMQAIGQSKTVQIIFPSGTQYQRQYSSGGSGWTTELTTKLPSGVTAYPTGGKIQFDKRGMAATKDTIFLVNSSQQWQYVVTNVLGRVNVYTYSW